MFAISLLCALTILLLAQYVPDVDSCSNRELACMIKEMAEDGKITLRNKHLRLYDFEDNASAYDNIRDVCSGKMAARSVYTCGRCLDAGPPGGYTKLSSELLEYIILASEYKYKITVNEIAGGCHSCNSSHYEGKAVDILVHWSTNELVKYLSQLCTDWDGAFLRKARNAHCQFE